MPPRGARMASTSKPWRTILRESGIGPTMARPAKSASRPANPICAKKAGRFRARILPMFATFFHELKAAGLPVTLREYLTLMEAMEKDLADRRVESFYYLSRAALVKDERNLDKFDRVFGHVFKGLDLIEESLGGEIRIEWLKKLTEKHLTEEEKKL